MEWHKPQWKQSIKWNLFYCSRGNQSNRLKENHISKERLIRVKYSQECFASLQDYLNIGAGLFQTVSQIQMDAYQQQI